MSTQRGIGKNTIGRSRCSGFVKLMGIETEQQHLVKGGAVPYELGLRLHWPRRNLRSAQRDIVRRDRLACAVTHHEDKHVAAFRRLCFARLIALRERRSR